MTIEQASHSWQSVRPPASPELEPYWLDRGIVTRRLPPMTLGSPVVEFDANQQPWFWSDAHDMLMMGLDRPALDAPPAEIAQRRIAFVQKKLERLLDDPNASYLRFVRLFLSKLPELWPQRGEIADFFAHTAPDPARDAAQVQAAFEAEWAIRRERWPHLRYPPARRDRSDSALVDRVLNGFYPCSLRWMPGQDPTTAGTKEVYVDFRWPKEPADLEGDYITPDTRLVLAGPWDPAGEFPFASLEPIRIEIDGRPVVPDGADPTDEASDFTAWGHAKRVLRMSLLNAGQHVMHLGRGHLVPGLYSVAMQSALDEGDALWGVLYPHLRSVDAINAYGAPLIFASTGILRHGSAFSQRGIEGLLRTALAAQDWAGFAPRRPLLASHRYARAAQLVWGAIERYCTAAVDALGGDRGSDDWAKARRLGHELHRLAPPWERFRDVPANEWVCGRELAERPRTQGGRSMRPLRPAGPGEPDRQDLIALLSHAIFHATFVHGWTNDQQFDDGGELLFSTLGQRKGPAPWEPPRDAADWNERYAPDADHAAYQLFLAETLARTEWGYLTAVREQPDRPTDHDKIRLEPDNDVPAALQAQIEGIRADYAAIAPGMTVDDLRARVNI